jgi:transcriptional regulator with PAS, ATPase and Fis domain
VSDETKTYAQKDEPDAGLVLVAIAWPSADKNVVWTLPRRGRVTVGREPTSDVVINDASVASTHAQLDVGERVVVRQKEGGETRVDGLSLPPGAAAELAVGAVVEIGRVSILLQRRGGAAPEARGQLVSIGDHEALIAGELAHTYDVVKRVAAGDLSVLVLGETGVGKDLVAELVHRMSPRARGPFIRVHCPTLSASLFESELFGHERGAFTGAATAKPGLVELADDGTLLLDEVGEIPESMQVKLLRVLEDRRVMRLGSTSGRVIDVRFVAASNRDLLEEVEAGRFRRDLYYRLSGLTITVPPLRDRRDEILPLAELFLAKVGRKGLVLGDDAKHLLHTHAFPGNVRELRLAIERACALAEGDTIGASDLDLDPSPPSAEASQPVLDMLERTAGNQSEAARRLGISRRTLATRLAVTKK